MSQIRLKLLISAIAVLLLAGIGYYKPKTADCYNVVYYYDGDTVKLDINGKQEKVRLLGIDTPEMNYDSDKKPDCYAKQASEQLKKIIGNSCVQIKTDQLAGQKDKYGRLLLYLYLPDNTFVNMQMVSQGHAFSYIYSDNQYKQEFEQAQQEAKSKQLGLWGKNCNYLK